jgi:hypothetical protein
MSYQYSEYRSRLFTEEGQVTFLGVRDAAFDLLRKAGAFSASAIFGHERTGPGEAWMMLACLDRMVELGELVEVTPRGVAGQHRIFHAGRH